MNYISAIYGIIIAIIVLDWIFRERKSFRRTEMIEGTPATASEYS